MQGVITAVPTPFSERLEPVEELFIDHCRWLLDNGCEGLNILGSTGEANSIDIDNRKRIMKWAANSLDRSRLMVGTGTPSLEETIGLTRHADALGYGVALVLPPYYYKPLSDDGLVRWYETLHEALGDSKIAIYFYNYPQMTGIKIPVTVIARLHEKFPERFAGIKDSSGDLPYCRELASSLTGFAVFPSSEVALGEAAASGFAGCISATTNQTSQLSGRIWAERASPRAADIDEVAAIRGAIAGPTLVASVKHLVAKRTGEAGWERLLPPFVSLNEAEKATLAGNLVKRAA